MKILNTPIFLILIIVVLSTRSSATPQEDEFNKRFGNDPNNTKAWPEMKSYYNEPDHTKVKKLVSGALKKISNAWDNIYFEVLEPVFKKGTVKFEATNYHPVRMEILGFTVHFKESTSKQMLKKLNANNDERWFMTQGLRKDCVYFVKWLHPGTDQWEFMLDKHVCGMKRTRRENYVKNFSVLLQEKRIEMLLLMCACAGTNVDCMAFVAIFSGVVANNFRGRVSTV